MYCILPQINETVLNSEVFLLLDWLSNKFALINTHTWWENRWIHAFAKDISLKWNTSSLNFDYQVHFTTMVITLLLNHPYLLTVHNTINCPVGWGCRIHRLLLWRGVRPPNESPGYDTKQSHGEVPVMLELWGTRSTPSLPSLPGSLWPRVVAPDKGPIYGLNRSKTCFLQIFAFKLRIYAKLNCLE